MNVGEFIKLLENIPNKEAQICFADFEPIRAVYPCQLGNKIYACVTDKEMFEPNNTETLDIDEQMHEQQQFDEEFAVAQAEFYEGLL